MVVAARSERSLSVLSADDVRAIHEASLRVLSETGVAMPLAPERQAQARELGLLVDSVTGRVRFPPALVAEAIDRAPSSYTLCARNPEDDVLIDGRRSHLALDGSAVQLIDLETGELRPSTRADLERAVRLADALDPISILCPAMSASDCAPHMQPIIETATLLTGSRKHALAMTVVENALSGAISLLAGADIVYGAGLLQAAKVFSFEQLLLDCEIFEMLRYLAAGIPIDEESLAVEVIEAVGPGGHFMEQEHTREHMREIWQPALLDRMPLEAWEKAGRPTALERAGERAREILAAHQPEPLHCEQQIGEIISARLGSEE